VYDKKSEYVGKKIFYGDLPDSINKWIVKYQNNYNVQLGLLVHPAPDFQHNNQLVILSKQQKTSCFNVCQKNLIVFAVYFAVRYCIKHTWLNHNDQFLYPNKNWEQDTEFQNDCLAFALFHGKNRISCKEGINHWIPFTEQEINAKERFQSRFMTNFIMGKIKPNENESLYNTVKVRTTPLEFSSEAKAVFDAGKELWKYYHQQPNINVNASLYDIKEYFKGRNEKGKMNNKSKDVIYNSLMKTLKEKMQVLANKIEKKVYLYEFLK